MSALFWIAFRVSSSIVSDDRVKNKNCERLGGRDEMDWLGMLCLKDTIHLVPSRREVMVVHIAAAGSTVTLDAA